MKVEVLAAVDFIKPMSNGRTRPVMLGCEDASGDRTEVVVKFRSRELTAKAQIAELLAAQLADDIGLDVPRAVVVNVPPGFEAIVPDPELAALVKASLGDNVGSVNIGPGFTTWPIGRAPHGGQRDQAAAIFAFDLLVQNPDRRVNNPNLWARSDRLGVYDHEQAFSSLFLPIIGGAPMPWVATDQAAGFDFLKQHVFYAALRGGSLDLDSFDEKLGDLTDEALEGYAEAVPKEWRDGNDLCENVVTYLGEARQNRSKLLNYVKHLLR
jgi:hypothetical protein